MKIHVKVIPRSSKNQLIKNPDGSYKIKLTAPPVDGEANEQLILFLSKEMKIPKYKIHIIKGLTGKNKIIQIDTEKEV
ncbi:MAG: DUF167 domain-containing protein [Candidatus Magasanikbacteria bacterium]